MSIITITTYLASISPVAVATLIALAYIYFAGGNWAWSMVVDAGLLALYVWKPSWGMLTFVLVLGSVRHIPALAREMVILFKWQEYQGWTLHLIVFLLPALLRYTNQKQPASADLPGAFGATIALPPMVEAKPAAAAPEPDPPLLLGEGFKLLNSDPTAPHVGVIGATQLGKTTFVGVLLAHRQGNDLVIATPKSEIDDPWFGAEVARPAASEDDMDYSPIDQAISKVHKEMLRRNMPGVRDRSGITLVLDEWHELAEIPGVVKKVVQMIRRGAAAGIRLILMSTDVNVRSWKMDGMAGVLDNLVFARVEDGRRWSLGRLDPSWRMVAPRTLDTGQVHGLAARVSLAGRGWVGARVTVPDPLLGGLLAAGVPVPPAGVGGDPPNLALGTGNGTGTEQGTPVEVLKILRSSGKTREWARASGCKFRDLDWTEAGKETP